MNACVEAKRPMDACRIMVLSVSWFWGFMLWFLFSIEDITSSLLQHDPRGFLHENLVLSLIFLFRLQRGDSRVSHDIKNLLTPAFPDFKHMGEAVNLNYRTIVFKDASLQIVSFVL